MFTVVVVLAMVAEISFAALHTQIVVFVDFFFGFCVMILEAATTSTIAQQQQEQQQQWC